MRAERWSLSALRLALLFAISVALCWAMASPAEAAPFELRSCQPGVADASAGPSGWRGANGLYNAPILLESDCPDGLGFNFSKPTIIGNSNSWTYGFSGWLKFSDVSVTFESQGSFDGYRVTVRGCADCDPIAVLDPASENWKVWTQRFDMAQSKSFVVHVECVVFNCPAGGRMKLHSFVASATDETNPTISVSGLGGGWTKRSTMKPSIHVTDVSQTGLAYVSGKIGSSVFWEPPTCVNYPASEDVEYFTLPFNCPERHNWTSLLDLRAFPDGRHELTLDARDGAGNVATQYRKTLKLDDTPPDPPYDVGFSGVTEHGWSGLRNVRPNWPIPDRHETATASAIADTWYDFRPRSAEVVDPPAFRHYVPYADGLLFGEIEIPADGLWDLFVWHTDQAENLGAKQKVTIGRDLDAPPPPEFDQQGWISRASLAAGFAQPMRLDVPPWLESGVCGVATTFTQSADSIVPTTPDISGAPSKIAIPASVPDGSSWLHARSISCAGLASAQAKVRVNVDSVRPRVGISGLPISGWTSDLSQARVTGRDDESGVDRIESSRAGIPQPSIDGDAMTLDLTEGRHEMTFRAVDRAGNSSDWFPVTVKYDSTPPSATFEPRSTDDPTLLIGWARDVTSGLDSAEVQIRPSGSQDDSWIALPTDLAPAEPNSVVRRFRARIPDDRLAAGLYDVRVISADAAGNRSAVYDLLGTGVNFTVSLPARPRPSIDASVALIATKCKPLVRNGCRKPVRCAARPKRCRLVETVARDQARKARTVAFTTRTALVGSVVDAGGAPVPNVGVQIHEAVPNGPRVAVGEVITDAAGQFTHRIAAGPNRRFFATVTATGTRLSATAHADLGVMASATLKAQVRRRADGNHLRLYGRLRGLVAGHSPKSVTVAFMYRNEGVWRPWFEIVGVDARGEFSTSTPFVLKRIPGADREVRTMAFIKSKDTAWPYENGQSNLIRLYRPK